jgi:branched-chain amino acid transport system substrate-binding protein
MSQKNETPALIVSLLITLGLLGGGFWWFVQRNNFLPFRSPIVQPVKLNLEERVSLGERILLATESSNPEFYSLKQAGINAIDQNQFPQAVKMFEAALQKERNAPETLIYLNNARIGKGKSYTIVVSVPIQTDGAGSAEILRGVAQAQQALNQAGGIRGVLLKVAIASDENDPEIAKQLANTFVQNTEILGVVGHYDSDVSLAASRIYNTGELVMISPISTSTKLSGFGPYIFRTVPNDAIAGRALAEYAIRTLKQKKVSLFFNSKSGYSRSLRQEFKTAVVATGGQIATEVDLIRPGFNPQQSVEQALKQGATALMLAANTSTLDQALQVVQANRKRSVLLAGDDVYAPRTLEHGKQAAVGMIVAVPWHIDADPNATFVRESRQLWRADVNWRSAIAYDATQALIAGLQQAPTRHGIQQALANPDFSAPGASQPIRFLSSGDRNARIQFVKVVPGQRSGTGFDFVPERN